MEKNGKGTCSINDRIEYQGEWKNEKYHGTGIFMASDGRRYEGEWEDGQRNGRSTSFEPNGGRYVNGKKINQMVKSPIHGLME